MFESSETAELQAGVRSRQNTLDLLLRQAERRIREDSKAVFASRNTGAVLIVKAGLEKVRDLREQLHAYRRNQAVARLEDRVSSIAHLASSLRLSLYFGASYDRC